MYKVNKIVGVNHAKDMLNSAKKKKRKKRKKAKAAQNDKVKIS